MLSYNILELLLRLPTPKPADAAATLFVPAGDTPRATSTTLDANLSSTQRQAVQCPGNAKADLSPALRLKQRKRPADAG